MVRMPSEDETRAEGAQGGNVAPAPVLAAASRVKANAYLDDAIKLAWLQTRPSLSGRARSMSSPR